MADRVGARRIRTRIARSIRRPPDRRLPRCRVVSGCILRCAYIGCLLMIHPMPRLRVSRRLPPFTPQSRAILPELPTTCSTRQSNVPKQAPLSPQAREADRTVPAVALAWAIRSAMAMAPRLPVPATGTIHCRLTRKRAPPRGAGHGNVARAGWRGRHGEAGRGGGVFRIRRARRRGRPDSTLAMAVHPGPPRRFAGRELGAGSHPLRPDPGPRKTLKREAGSTLMVRFAPPCDGGGDSVI